MPMLYEVVSFFLLSGVGWHVVEMVAAQQQLSQYYIVLLVVPFFFTATPRWSGCLQLLGRPLSIHIMKSGRKREATI